MLKTLLMYSKHIGEHKNQRHRRYLSTYRGCYALKCVFYLVDTNRFSKMGTQGISVNKRKIYAFIMFFEK